MGKTTENIEYYLDPENDKDYLQDLLLNIKEAFINQENLNFKIVEPKEKGFLVKVGGLFGYVSYHHMPWEYISIDYWNNASDFLINQIFTGKIHKLDENPISIIIDGKTQTFEKPQLTEFNQYRGIVLNKAKYGLFIDIGFHFNWKFGSLLGLLHKSGLIDQTDYDNTNEGKEITATFCGYNQEDKLIFGDNIDRGKWMTDELYQLIGTVQKINVVKKDGENIKYLVLNKHKARIPVMQEHYPNFRASAKKFIEKLENGQVIDCLVLRMNKTKDCFVLKLLIEPKN